jgi:hypothetical protein
VQGEAQRWFRRQPAACPFGTTWWTRWRQDASLHWAPSSARADGHRCGSGRRGRGAPIAQKQPVGVVGAQNIKFGRGGRRLEDQPWCHRVAEPGAALNFAERGLRIMTRHR